jgi:predicted phosphohydrolase
MIIEPTDRIAVTDLFESWNDLAEGLVITGDLTIGTWLKEDLEIISRVFKHPVYFVLGNHDYWYSGFKKIDDYTKSLNLPNIHYLGNGSVTLNDVTLCGCDGWYDGRNGKIDRYLMNDFLLIDEFKLQIAMPNDDWYLSMMKIRAKQQVEILTKQLQNTSDKVIIATHIPPYPESARYKKQKSSRDFLPFYTSWITGNVIDQFAKQNPNKQIVVLCGHSHCEYTYKRFDNLVIHTAFAEYRDPQLAGLIDLDKFEVLFESHE